MLAKPAKNSPTVQNYKHAGYLCRKQIICKSSFRAPKSSFCTQLLSFQAQNNPAFLLLADGSLIFEGFASIASPAKEQTSLSRLRRG